MSVFCIAENLILKSSKMWSCEDVFVLALCQTPFQVSLLFRCVIWIPLAVSLNLGNPIIQALIRRLQEGKHQPPLTVTRSPCFRCGAGQRNAPDKWKC